MDSKLVDLCVRYRQPSCTQPRECARRILQSTRCKTRAIRDILYAVQLQQYIHKSDEILSTLRMHESDRVFFYLFDRLHFRQRDAELFLDKVWHTQRE